MKQWEYCSVKLIWREERKNLENFKVRVVYYKPKGLRDVEDIQTDIAVTDYLAISAVGYVIADLGAEGWELVHMQHSAGDQGFQLQIEAMLKREVGNVGKPVAKHKVQGELKHDDK